jgi:hypothetical protein
MEIVFDPIMPGFVQVFGCRHDHLTTLSGGRRPKSAAVPRALWGFAERARVKGGIALERMIAEVNSVHAWADRGGYRRQNRWHNQHRRGFVARAQRTGAEEAHWSLHDLIAFILDLIWDQSDTSPAPP